MQKKLFLSAALSLYLFSAGCAYFNTFYNAQEKFKGAEDTYRKLDENRKFPRQLTQDYESAIAKSQKVIENFPDSKWVDNSMYIYAVSNYRLEKYIVARKMFRRLTIEFPQSPYYQEAMLWIARCNYMNNEKKLAFSLLETFTEDPRNTDYIGDAMILYAQLAVEEGNMALADTAYQKAVTIIKDKERKAELYYEYANHLINTDRMDQALQELDQVRELSVNRELRAKAQLLYAKVYRLEKNYAASENIIKEMLVDEKYQTLYPDLNLELAEIYRNLGDIDRAIERNKSIIEEYPNTLQASVAGFRIGEMELYLRGDLLKAQEYYNSCIRNDKNSFEAGESKNRLKTIMQFSGQRSHLIQLERKTHQLKDSPLSYYESLLDSAAIDSAAALQLESYKVDAEKYVTELANQAEILSFTFSLHDSSLKIYRNIERDFPFSRKLPWLLYARAFLNRTELGDTLRADSLINELISRYPDSPYTAYASGKEFSPQAIREEDQKKVYHIESTADSTESHTLIRQFMALIPQLRDTLSLAQSWHYLAWIYDSGLNDLDSALYYYQVVADSFPQTSYAEDSKSRIIKLTGIINESMLSDSSAALPQETPEENQSHE